MRLRARIQLANYSAVATVVVCTAAMIVLFVHDFGVHNYHGPNDSSKDASGAWRCPLHFLATKALSTKCADLSVAYDRAAFCVDVALGRMFADLKAAGRWRNTLAGTPARME